MSRLLLALSGIGLVAVLTFLSVQPGESDMRSDVTRVGVVVSTDRIPAGTSVVEALDLGLLEVRELDENLVPAFAVDDPSLLAGISASDLEEGVIVTAEIFR